MSRWTSVSLLRPESWWMDAFSSQIFYVEHVSETDLQALRTTGWDTALFVC